MSLVTPDIGLLFWMLLIFLVVFFILAKFGFPIVTNMVEKRNEHIDKSLQLAREAEEKMRNLTDEQTKMINDTKKQQAELLKEASETREKMIQQAKEDAQVEAEKILAKARTEIAAEKESAIRDVRRQVAMLSVEIAEKVLRKDLSDSKEQMDLVDKLTKEVSSENLSNKAN